MQCIMCPDSRYHDDDCQQMITAPDMHVRHRPSEQQNLSRLCNTNLHPLTASDWIIHTDNDVRVTTHRLLVNPPPKKNSHRLCHQRISICPRQGHPSLLEHLPNRHLVTSMEKHRLWCLCWLLLLLTFHKCCSRCRFQPYDCVIIRFVE